LVQVPSEADKANITVAAPNLPAKVTASPLELRDVPVDVDWSKYQL
jgi:hypothetical protein